MIDTIKRPGRITASRALDFMTKGRGGIEFGETARTYAKELALKKLGFVDEDQYESYAMQRGIELEPDAREVYARSRGIEVEMPGFITLGDHIGCTPDGLVGEDGMLEIKAPGWKNHVDYILQGAERRYIMQMQFQLMVTDRKWCDFMTFHPDMPEGLQAKVHRYERDEVMIAEMQARIEPFIVLRDTYYEQLKGI